MNKLRLLIIGFFVLLLFLLVSAWFLFQKSPEQEGGQVTPAVLTPTPSRDEYFVVSTTPVDNATDVPLNQAITVVFNKPLPRDAVKFDIFPETEVSVSMTGTVLTATPATPLQPGTSYRYGITYDESLGIVQSLFQFTALGPTPTSPPDTRDVKLLEEIERDNLEHYPDIYLANKTPYATDIFAITSYYVEAEGGVPGHDAFLIEVLKENDYATVTDEQRARAKADAEAWMRSIGLTDAQIQQLEIEIVN
ncbi:Ig-like domain-containing protein [Candidatus Roizmanbacteria bacterium]|nr:Ig-like domain-containing protein [Candidatus Roizmanbacteria bacterium]